MELGRKNKVVKVRVFEQSYRQLITRFKFFAQYIVEFMNTEQFHVFFPSKLEQGYPNAGNRGRCLNYGSS